MKKLIKISNFAMFLIMFTIIILLTVFIIGASFNTLLTSCRAITYSIETIKDHFLTYKIEKTANKGELLPEAKALCERLEYKSKGVIESSTISFLFTLLNSFVIALGLYFINVFRTKSNKIKKWVKEQSTFNSYISLSSIISHDFTSLSQLSWILIKDKNHPCIFKINDFLRNLKTNLEIATRQKIAIAKPMVKYFWDRFREIKNNFTKVPKLGDKVFSICDEIEEILNDAKFEENHDNLFKGIETDWDD